MKIIELILDEDNNEIGIEAISVVANGAIESDFIALNNQEVKLAEIDKEKRLLMGALLIPNKPIYRKSGDEEYYIFFSKILFQEHHKCIYRMVINRIQL